MLQHMQYLYKIDILKRKMDKNHENPFKLFCFLCNIIQTRQLSQFFNSTEIIIYIFNKVSLEPSMMTSLESTLGKLTK